MVDTTGGYRYLYLDVDDPEWTSPITGMIYVRAYENHVRLAETEEMRDTEEIQDAEEIRESATGEMWEFATEEISENENEITDKAE